MAKQDNSVKNFPNLRFPGFEGEWEMKKLGEIGEVINGLTYSPNDIDDNGVLVLRSSNVQNSIVTFQDNVFVKTETFNPVKENDILICARNGSKNLIGKNAIINKENEGLAFGAFMTVYRSPYNKFVFQWFGTQVYKEIVHKNLGATINSINGSDLKKFVIPFPSISEQEKISIFLSSVDERIITQRKTIEKLETSMRGFREKIFSQKLRFKDKNGDEFSKWSLHKLGDKGEFFSGGTPLTSNKHFYNGKIPFIKSGEINAEKTNQFISDEALRNSSAKLVEVGDLLFALYGATSGESGLSKINGAINQAILCIRTNENNIYLLNYLRFKKESILKTYLQGGQGNLSTEIIKSLVVPIPQIEEQNKIANFLYLINDKIENEKKILHEFETQKSHLLLNLFI